MEKPDVQIVQLAPMRVAYALGYGEGPEGLAWAKILAWAQGAGLDLKTHRFFGFNNPSPAPGSPNYGYEQWMTIGPEVKPAGEVQVKDFPGGLYGVARCQGPQNIPQAWQALMVWRENSPYKAAHHQWLEECLSPELLGLAEPPWEKLLFDLYLPIAK